MPTIATTLSGRHARPRPRGRILSALLLASALAAGCRGKSEEERLKEGEDLLNQQNFLGATIVFQEFLKKFPESPRAQKARIQLAQCYMVDKDFGRAREILDEVVQRAGGPDSQYGLNAVMFKLDSYVREQQPAKALEEAMATSPSLRTVEPVFQDLFAMRVADLLYLNQREDDAIRTYQSFAGRPGVHPDLQLKAIMSAAAIHERRQDLESVRGIYAGFLEKHPESEAGLAVNLRLAQTLVRMNKAEDASARFDAAEAIVQKKIDSVAAPEKETADGLRAQLMLQLAEIKNAREKREDAKAVLRKVMDDYPLTGARPLAMLMMGELERLSGNKEAALEHFNQVVTGYPGTQLAQQAYFKAQELTGPARGDGATTGTMGTADGATTAGPAAAPAS